MPLGDRRRRQARGWGAVGRKTVGRGAVGHPAVTGRRTVVRRADLQQGRLLARPQRPAARSLPVPEERGGRGPIRRGPQPPLVPGAGRRGQEGPRQLNQAVLRQRAQPAQETRPTFGRRELPDGARATSELVQQVQLDAVEPGVVEAQACLPRRGHLGDQLEAFEHARREHRPDDRRERREVAVGA